MVDYGTRDTEYAVIRTRLRLTRVYQQAARDIEEKMRKWQEGHKARNELYLQKLAEKKITKADYEAWLRGQVFQGKQWQARRDEIQAVLYNADRATANIINRGKIGVFASNANYIGYGLEHDLNVNTGFTLYDESTVARLIDEHPDMLPPARVEKPLAYTYYNRLVNTSITQGIIQGEGIPEIAKRIAETTSESSYKSALRNARTAYTGAQNAGRIEGLHQAQKLGVKVKKKWIATLDARTRDAHADLDGQVREVDDPFESELGEIMFPGDPSAKAGNVYNCRCTLTYVYPDYPDEGAQRRDNETGEVIGNMTYKEWERTKQEEEKSVDRDNPRRSAILPPSEYARRFSGVTESETVNSRIAQKATDMLKHRSGTAYEDMYLFDALTGKVLAAQTHSKEEQTVNYNAAMNRVIKKRGGGSIVTLHNHPDSYPPSGGDFESMFMRGYKQGVIACHDGTVYTYQVGKQRFSGKLYDMTVAKYMNPPYNMGIHKAYEKTLEDFSEQYGLRWSKNGR